MRERRESVPAGAASSVALVEEREREKDLGVRKKKKKFE